MIDLYHSDSFFMVFPQWIYLSLLNFSLTNGKDWYNCSLIDFFEASIWLIWLGNCQDFSKLGSFSLLTISDAFMGLLVIVIHSSVVSFIMIDAFLAFMRKGWGQNFLFGVGVILEYKSFGEALGQMVHCCEWLIVADKFMIVWELIEAKLSQMKAAN